MPIVNNYSEGRDYESIMSTTALRTQIKLMLVKNTYDSVEAFFNDVQNWLRKQEAHFTDGYVYEHVQAVIAEQPIQLDWTFEPQVIRCFMTDEQIVNMLSNPAYDDLVVYMNSMGIPWEKHGNGRYIYFGFVYPEHQAVLEAYGAQFENKVK